MGLCLGTPKKMVFQSPPSCNLKRKSAAIVTNNEIQRKVKHACPALAEMSQCHHKHGADECSLYGALLAIRLRSLQKRTRKILINKIDNLVFEAEMGEMDNVPISSSQTWSYVISSPSNVADLSS